MDNITDPNDMNKISAQNTEAIEEVPDPDSVANPAGSTNLPDPTNDSTQDDSTKTYQHDFDGGDDDVDPFINEATEDPTEELQVPASEFKDELDKLALDDLGNESEDMRESIEDRDEADGNSASTA